QNLALVQGARPPFAFDSLGIRVSSFDVFLEVWVSCLPISFHFNNSDLSKFLDHPNVSPPGFVWVAADSAPVVWGKDPFHRGGSQDSGLDPKPGGELLLMQNFPYALSRETLLTDIVHTR